MVGGSRPYDFGDPFEESEAIDGMNQNGSRQHLLDLVSLDVADQMPANVGRELLGSFDELLWSAFGEIADAQFNEPMHPRQFGVLRDRDQRDIARCAASASTSGRDLRSNSL